MILCLTQVISETGLIPAGALAVFFRPNFLPAKRLLIQSPKINLRKLRLRVIAECQARPAIIAETAMCKRRRPVGFIGRVRVKRRRYVACWDRYVLRDGAACEFAAHGALACGILQFLLNYKL
jgi:hypothetical protein